ncbi:hypothetical protein BASA83_008613 [Batrachochytrium salamandrivorans]|nr:hypothetical protein BASA83_008613 [Batrachochytrium salamandrivorans]
MSFEYYRITDFIARLRSATSTSRRSNISATSFLLMDFGWIRPKSQLFRVGRHQRKPFILEDRCIGLCISGVLSQYDDSNTLRPIAFYARQMNSAEQNYEIYDKELLAVVESFKHCDIFSKAVSIQSPSYATTRT